MKKISFYIIILITSISFDSKSQQKENGSSLFFKSTYNYKLVRQTIAYQFNIKEHAFYLGPQITTILKPIYDPVDLYVKNTFGIDFGYNYRFKIRPTSRLNPFLEINFSIYKLKFTEFQNGPPFSQKRENLMLENTFCFGIDYQIMKNFNLKAGLGFGSYGGFFLLIDDFTPSSFLTIQYKFNHQPQNH
jgi:hypothetical protein